MINRQDLHAQFLDFLAAAVVAGFPDVREWELVPADSGRPWMLTRDDESNTPFPRIVGWTLAEAAATLAAYAAALRAAQSVLSRTDRFELTEVEVTG